MTPLPDLPLVTIVTPSYNTGKFIEETLRSVRDQDYPRIEHIVLDSNSTDGSLEIISRFPHVHLVPSAPPTLTAKVDLGFSMAQGDIVGWLCADDCYLPGAIAKAVQALKEHPDAGMVYCNFLEVDENSVEIVRRPSKQVGVRELRDERLYVPTQGAFMRREALEHAGASLDRRYPLVCDWDLWIRIAKLYPLVYVNDWWGSFRVHQSQLSEIYKYEFWVQQRAMTRGHGGHYFSPLFWYYWGAKVVRAAAMLRQGQFRAFGSKLRDLYGWISRVVTRKDRSHSVPH